MPTEAEVAEIRKLASEGKSVNTIKDRLELPKSTVYYHFRKEVGQKQKENALTIPGDEEVKGEICGVFAGDGNFYFEEENYKYRIRIFLNYNQNYWKILADFLEENLKKAPVVYKFPDKSRATLDYKSKRLYEMFKEYLAWEKDKTATIKLKSRETVSQEFKIGFLRGLIDTDGFSHPDHRSTWFNSISRALMRDVSRILNGFGIEHNLRVNEDKRENCRTMYRVAVYGEESAELKAKIDPRHPKKA